MSDQDDHVPCRKGIYGDAAASRALLDSLDKPAAKPSEPERVWVILDATREWTPAAGGVGRGVTLLRRFKLPSGVTVPPGGIPRLGIDFQVGPGAEHGSIQGHCPCGCGNPMAQGPHAGLSAETVAYIEDWKVSHGKR